VIALAGPAGPAGPAAGAARPGFHDHHRFFAHNAEKRWWSPAIWLRRSP